MNLNATLIFEIISFLLLVGILTKLVYRPLLKFLDQRAHQIKRDMEEAERQRREAEKKYAESKQALEEAKRDALALKEEAKLQSQERRDEILKEAQEKTSILVEESRKDVLKEIETAKLSLGKFISEASVLMASKILGREVKKEDHETLLKEGVKSLKDNE